MMAAYYNENDPKTAAWLRELIAEGRIAPGYVDERSILDVRPHELTEYTQQHFFAGIGGWPFALRLSGWPDGRPVRTGSCPCQPFSIAGKGLGEKDERHLWPAFRDIITFGEPAITFGEQVASADGRDWLSGVRADLEALGYEVGGADLCAAGVGAPHPRQRLYWLANPSSTRRIRTKQRAEEKARNETRMQLPCSDGEAGRLVLANGSGRQQGRQGAAANGHGRATEPASGDGNIGVEYSMGEGREQRGAESDRRGSSCGCGSCSVGVGNAAGERRNSFGDDNDAAERGAFAPGITSPWGNYDVLPFRYGKFRRVEAGTFPLAHGIPGRVGLLRGYGNAIVPQLAAEFIQASLEALAGTIERLK